MAPNWYAVALIDGQQMLLHRFITGAKCGQDIDHHDGDGLNNSRVNLRLATVRNNRANQVARNQTGYLGVYAAPYERWRVRIVRNRKTLFHDTFGDAESAARAYDDAARKIHGPFATLNFPEIGERSARTGEIRRV